MKEFKSIEYGIFNILLAIVNNEVYFKTADIKNILHIQDYDNYHKDTQEPTKQTTNFCNIHSVLNLIKSSSIYYKDGFSLWIQEEYHRLKSGITIEIIN